MLFFPSYKNQVENRAIFSDDGATLEEIASTMHKSTKTIASKIITIPAELILVSKASRPYHYKINLTTLSQYSKK